MKPLIQQQKLIEWCWVADSASDSNNTYLELQLFKSSFAAGKALACTLEQSTDTFLPAFHPFQCTESLHGAQEMLLKSMHIKSFQPKGAGCCGIQ